VIWALVAIAIGADLFLVWKRPTASLDLMPIQAGIDNFLHNRDVYTGPQRPYLFPPSSLLLLFPLGLGGLEQERAVYSLVERIR
jgi:hypothetical protein